MSATFDATTTSEYEAATTASARSALIVAALTGTVSVKVFDGSDVEKGTGTMASPWATASGDTVTVGEVSSFSVSATATPDADWYIRFQNAGATRWVRGSFGLSGSGQDFTWSLSTWTSGQTGTIGTATIVTTGNAPPVFSVAPSSETLPPSGGTIQFTASDPEGLAVTYSLSARTGFTINATTGLVTVTSAAAGTTGNITVTASDGVLSTSRTCLVEVEAVTGATFTIPTTASTYNASAVNPGDTIVIARGSSGTRGPLKITNIAGTINNRITIRPDPTGRVTIRRAIAGGSGFILHFENCLHFTVDGYLASATGGRGIKVQHATDTSTADDNATAWVQVNGTSSYATLRYLEVDGGFPADSDRGIGIQFKDQAVTRTANPGDWRQNILVEHCYIYDTGNSGMYLGGNYVADEIPWKNITVRYNTVERTGNAGITAKGWWSGLNRIHGNTIRNTGTLVSNPDQRVGISVFSGQADVYDNIVTDASSGGTDQTPHGIQLFTDDGPDPTTAESGYGTFATFVCRVYNNVVARAAVYGINAGRQAGKTPVEPYIFNNTVVNSGTTNIRTASISGGFVRNNISLGTGATINSDAPASNNLTSGSLASVFVAPGSDDYHLAGEQAAVDGAGTELDISANDIEGTSRAGTASKGAYEYA